MDQSNQLYKQNHLKLQYLLNLNSRATIQHSVPGKLIFNTCGKRCFKISVYFKFDLSSFLKQIHYISLNLDIVSFFSSIFSACAILTAVCKSNNTAGTFSVPARRFLSCSPPNSNGCKFHTVSCI